MTAYALQNSTTHTHDDPALAGADLYITPSAVQRLQVLLPIESHDKGAAQRLRLRIDSGGCSGFQYNFSFDDSTHTDDQIYTYQDIAVVIDDISLNFIKGSHIDFYEDLMGANFLIKNPNAASSCGCGNSFSVM